MADFDASTPQLRAVKKLFAAYLSLDVNNVEPLLSENYQYEAFPESADLPREAKKGHLQAWGRIFSSVKKHDVRIRRQRTASKLRLISTTPRSFITK